ncbi:MFS general substrate transporter [Apiospora arundinis]|uniref:MFS general substrate transporter n=1 Tax=Apiospora arundinis TaxID=335852 RepID=A0ABR2JIL2_9PEZI
MAGSPRRLVAISVAFALFTDGSVYTLIVPFLPQLFESRLAIPDTEVERWTSLALAMYGIASLVSTWIAAYYTDRCKNKSHLFMLGNLVLLASTLCFFLGPAPGYILVARALQGAAGAFLYISGLAFLISHIDPEFIGFYMGYMTLACNMGELVGPLVGGSLYEHVGHWAVFGVTEAMIAVDMILRLLIREPKTDPRNTSRQRVNSSKFAHISDEERQWLQNDDNYDEDEKHPSIYGRTRTVVIHSDDAALSKAAAGSSVFDENYDHDAGAKAVAVLKDIRSNAVISVAFTTVTGIVRCALEATIPLYVFHNFSWNSTLSGAAIFALLSPAVICPWVGRHTARYGPRGLSIYTFAAVGVLLATLGLLTLIKPARAGSAWMVVKEVLFVIDLFLIGICVAVTTAAHTTTQSAFAQKGDQLLARFGSRPRGDDDDHVYDDGNYQLSSCHLDGGISWGLTYLTSGVLLAGNSTAWALGMFLGPLAADLFGFGSDAEWMRLCWFLAGLSWVAALGIGVVWRRNPELFPEETT